MAADLRAPRDIVVKSMRAAALAAITVLVAAATLTSFAESYRALYDWASRHGVHGLWAAIWPLQVDTFIGVGELALFVALADSWQLRSRAAAWVVTALGLAVSVAGNVGHADVHDWASRATAAVPPLAAAAALAVGLGVLKRVVATRAPKAAVDSPPAGLNGYAHEAAERFAAELSAGRVPSIRAIKSGLGIGQPKAGEVQRYLESITRT
jgi:Protein of unknown function (DUF2637)